MRRLPPRANTAAPAAVFIRVHSGRGFPLDESEFVMSVSTALPQRSIGDLTVSALGLGCMGMSYAYGPTDRPEALATLNHAIDRGVTLLDTADIYGAGDNERLLAEVLRARRDEVVLATKCGIVLDPDVGYPGGVNGTPDYIRASADASLERLGIDVIDLYYLHRVDTTVPIEESVGALADLVAAGKVRQIGLSEPSAATLRRAAAVHPIAAVQSEWSIFSRDIEAEVVPAAREIGATVVPYSPLGRGMLTGDAAAMSPGAGDYRATLPRWQADNLAANRAVVAKVVAIAEELSSTPAQVALAWLLGQGSDIVPIPGTKRRRYLDDNLGALAVHLSDDTVAELSALSALGERSDNPDWINRDSA